MNRAIELLMSEVLNEDQRNELQHALNNYEPDQIQNLVDEIEDEICCFRR
jgi:hypothetical protein